MFHIPQAYHGVKEGQTYIFPPPPLYLSPKLPRSLYLFFFIRLKVLQMNTGSQARSRGYYHFIPFDFAHSNSEQKNTSTSIAIILLSILEVMILSRNHLDRSD